MIEEIDLKINMLLKYRDSENVLKSPDLRASICTLIEKSYFLESIILFQKTFYENCNNQFFTANSAVSRYYRDWGLHDIADIYDELSFIAKDYLVK